MMRGLIGLVAAGALVLGACSSGDDGGGADPAVTAAPAVTIANPPSAPPTPAGTTPPSNVASAAPSVQTGALDPGMTLATDPPPALTMPAVAVTGAPSTSAPYDCEIYRDPAHWICRETGGDICDGSFPLTEVAADGSTHEEPSDVAVDPGVDCFYVYPTVSGDPSYNSDLIPDSEVVTTQLQAARFNQVCQVFAPVYRSVTLGGLFGSVPGDFASGWQMAYEDVLDAWRYYLANLNHGRPVVILAHSQGSFHVVTLLRDEIDPDPAERALVVSAIIPGTSFQVAPGRDVGGDTQNMPLCREAGQVGCVVTFQTYRDAVPPTAGALFGQPDATTASACTNPASLAGGPAPLDGAFPAGAWVFAAPDTAPAVTTPFVAVPGLVTGECKERDGYNYLAVTVNADPADPRADDIPGDGAPNWGLHTIDMNIAQETLIELVRTQSAAFLAAR